MDSPGVKMKMTYINQTIKTILSRTCCRAFSAKPVPDKFIRILLAAAQAAPSAKNRQPWYFIVIKNRQLKNELAQMAAIGRLRQFTGWDKKSALQMIKGSGYTNSNDRIIAQAPVVILVLRNSDPSYQEALNPELNIKEEQGVACTAYSIMLAAESLGLKSCWLCSALYLNRSTSEVKNLYLDKIFANYGIVWQPNWQPRAFIPIGYPAVITTKPPRKKITSIYQLIKSSSS